MAVTLVAGVKLGNSGGCDTAVAGVKLGNSGGCDTAVRCVLVTLRSVACHQNRP